MNITIKDCNGNTHSGYWNEKIYKSNLADPALKRMYIDNKEIHITEEEYTKIIGGKDKLKRIQELDKLHKIESEISDLSLYAKLDIILSILDDDNNSLQDIFMTTYGESIIMSDFHRKLFSIYKEEKSKKIEVRENESLASIIRRLKTRGNFEEEYSAVFNNILLSSKNANINKAYNEIYGMDYVKYKEYNNKEWGVWYERFKRDKKSKI